MRAIGYFTAEEGEGPSVLKARFEDFCRLNLHQAVTTFEAAPSGDRDDDLGELVDYLERVGADFLVVVSSAADLGGDLESVARSLVALDRLDVEVVCMDDEYPNSLQNAIHLFGVDGVSSERSSRVKESMSILALEGRALGRPPYGYRIGPGGRLEIDSGEAWVVRMIYRMYTRYGQGLRLIARDLNERGLTTRKGGSWSIVSVRDVLRNPVYIGAYTRLGIRRPNAHESIVSSEDFRASQEIARSRQPFGRVNRSEPFLLSGIAYCAYCDNKMMGVTRRRTWKRKDGAMSSGTYRYYQCQSRNNQGRCGYHTWRESKLEAVVVCQMRAAIGDGASVPGRAENLRRIREAEVSNAERRFLDAARRAARKEITTRVLGEYIGELDAARQRAIDEGPIDTEAALSDWSSLGFAQRRAIVEQGVARVVVEDERAEVVLG